MWSSEVGSQQKEKERGRKEKGERVRELDCATLGLQQQQKTLFPRTFSSGDCARYSTFLGALWETAVIHHDENSFWGKVYGYSTLAPQAECRSDSARWLSIINNQNISSQAGKNDHCWAFNG